MSKMQLLFARILVVTLITGSMPFSVFALDVSGSTGDETVSSVVTVSVGSSTEDEVAVDAAVLTTSGSVGDEVASVVAPSASVISGGSTGDEGFAVVLPTSGSTGDAASTIPTSGSVGEETLVAIPTSGSVGDEGAILPTSGSIGDSGSTIPTSGSTGDGGSAIPTSGSTGDEGTLSYPRPVVSSLFPTSGAVGISVIMRGTNFNSHSLVYFGTVIVAPTAISSESLTFTVPIAANLGDYHVYTINGGSLSSNDIIFKVTGIIGGNPVPTSGSIGDDGSTIPTSSSTGDEGGTALPTSGSTGDEEIKIPTSSSVGDEGSTIPTSGSTGDEEVGATSPYPTLVSLTPISGAVGTSVVMRGTNFDSSSKVYFGTIVVTPSAISPESLTFVVPANANMGPYRVYATNNSVRSSNDAMFTVTATTGGSIPTSGSTGDEGGGTIPTSDSTGDEGGGNIPACSIATLSSSLTVAATVSQAFSYTLTSVTSPVSTNTGTFSIGGTLPAGLTFNPTTGIISGTPTTAGAFNIPVTVTNSCGSSAATITVTVSAATTGGGDTGGGTTPPTTGGGTTNPASGGGGGGGGGGSILVTISNVSVCPVNSGSVEVKWYTNYDTSSRVLFGTSSVSVLGGSPLFGYQNGTEKNSTGTTTHKAIINGLVSGTKYFFRSASGFSQIGYTETVSSEVSIIAGAGAQCVNQAVSNVVAFPPEVANSNASCPFITDFMRRDLNNNVEQVFRLQIFLKAIQGFDVDSTGVFDAKTEAAVVAFQNRNAEDVLSPWGVNTKATGYVYIMTKQKINQIMCGGSLQNPVEQKVVNDYREVEQQKIELPVEPGVTPPAEETPTIIIGLSDKKDGIATAPVVDSSNLAAAVAAASSTDTSSSQVCTELCNNPVPDLISRILNWSPISLLKMFGF